MAKKSTQKSKDDLSERTDDQLKQRLEHSREQLWLLRKDLATGKVKNVREIKHLRKTIARIMTLQTWRKKQEN